MAGTLRRSRGQLMLLARFSRPRWLLPLLLWWWAIAGLAGDVLELRFGYVDGLGAFALVAHAAIAFYANYALGYGLLWTATEQGFEVHRRGGSLRRDWAGVERFFVLQTYPLRYGFFALRTLLAGARSKRRRRVLEQNNSDAEVKALVDAGGKVILGRDFNSGELIALGDEELVRHTMIVGATGSGKTTSLRRMLSDAISMDYAALVIDLKGDPQLAGELHDLAAYYGRPFAMFSDTPGLRCDRWNPLTSGDAVTRRDKLIALSEWSEPYYRTICERYAQAAFATFDAIGKVPTIGDLVELLDSPHKLAQLNTRNPDEAARARLAGYLATVEDDKQQRSALSGFAARVGTLVDPGGALHAGDHLSDQVLELDAMLESGGVVCFTLNSSRGRASSAQLASLAILDVLSIVGERIAHGTSWPALVAIDEFSALEADHVNGLLARARSAKVGVILSTQEFADLTRVDEGFRDQVLGNTANKIIHRQDVPDSAELAASLLGTHTVIKPTYKMDETGVEAMLGNTYTGEASHRPVEEFIVHPNVIKQLATGNALVIRKEPHLNWHITAMSPPPTLPQMPIHEPAAEPHGDDEHHTTDPAVVEAPQDDVDAEVVEEPQKGSSILAMLDDIHDEGSSS